MSLATSNKIMNHFTFVKHHDSPSTLAGYLQFETAVDAFLTTLWNQRTRNLSVAIPS